MIVVAVVVKWCCCTVSTSTKISVIKSRSSLQSLTIYTWFLGTCLIFTTIHMSEHKITITYDSDFVSIIQCLGAKNSILCHELKHQLKPILIPKYAILDLA